MPSGLEQLSCEASRVVAYCEDGKNKKKLARGALERRRRLVAGRVFSALAEARSTTWPPGAKATMAGWVTVC